MSLADSPARELQKFVIGYISGDKDNRLEAAQKLSGQNWSVEDVIAPSSSLSSQERLAIYCRMYPLRLGGAVREDFPLVCKLLGDRQSQMIEDYLQAHPSDTYTLDEYARHVPSFLEKSDYADKSLLVDVARLEWSMVAAFRAPDEECCLREELLSCEELFDLRLALHPSVAILKSDYAIFDLLKTYLEDESRSLEPQQSPQYGVVWRQDFQVWRRTLSPAYHLFLSLLGESEPLGECVEQAIGQYSEVEPTSLMQTFASWIDEGYFVHHRV